MSTILNMLKSIYRLVNGIERENAYLNSEMSILIDRTSLSFGF